MRRVAALSSVLLPLITLAFGSAFAAPVQYEFRAFVGTHDLDGEVMLPPQLTPDTQFIGTFTFDPARTEDGAIAPVTDFRLRTLDGTQILSNTDTSSALFSKLETRTQGGVESLLLTVVIDNARLQKTIEIQMSWASPGQGQLPADPRTVNILALQPYGWKLAILGYEWFCYPQCQSTTERIDAQIFNMKRAAAAVEYEQKFTSAPPRWTDTGGDWTTQSGYYANAANVAFTSSVYTGQTLQPFVEVRADLYSGFTAAGNAMGLLLNYQNASNFYEVRFTANGVVTINKVVNGVRTMLETGSYSVPPKTFFHVSVLRDFDAIEVRINDGAAVIAEDGALSDGRAGLFASWNRARFDNFVIDQLSSWGDGFLTDFSSAVHSFRPRAGTWVTENGVYRNTSNQSAAISTEGFPRAGDFALHARINLQWSAAGNRGGLVYDLRDLQNYNAVLISPRTATRLGTVEVIEVRNGVRKVVASSTDVNVVAGRWSEVSVSRVDAVVRVAATGMSAPFITLRQGTTGGHLGVIASWNLVRFDDVVFRAQSGPT